MKTAAYSWRLSAGKKAKLKEEARREGIPLSALLNRVTADWLAQCRSARNADEAEQAAIRKRAMVAVGTIRGGDPTRSARSGDLVREIIYNGHVKESDALARRFGRRAD